jgi:hypothetical protein
MEATTTTMHLVSTSNQIHIANCILLPLRNTNLNNTPTIVELPVNLPQLPTPLPYYRARRATNI